MNTDKLNELKLTLLAMAQHQGASHPAIKEVEELFAWIESQSKQLESADKKSRILAQQVLELTQELENVRSDFGGDQR